MSDTEPHGFPLKDHLGFTIDYGQGTATATLELDERHHNPNGVAHGAVTFTLMDTAMGGAVVSVIPEDHFCATIEIHTRCHRGVSEGPLTAEAVVMAPGRRIVHLEAKTLDGDGRLIASATGSFAVMPRPTGS